ncbi:MAG TPA: type II secretion system protein [Thermoanaerobaculia bacterium]|nr:type II secretion system protein [Thermoanaerobaculia bacterium]
MLRMSADVERKGCVRKAEAGFTLIEMMIVVAIIATLSALVAPRVNRYLVHSRAVASQEDLRSVGTVFASYLLMTGRSLGYSGDTLSPNDYQAVPATDLARFLDAEIPEHDHFGNLIDYRVDIWPNPNVLVARSSGSDGLFEPGYDIYNPRFGPCTGNGQQDIFIEDLVVVNGQLIAKLRNPPCWPMG